MTKEHHDEGNEPRTESLSSAGVAQFILQRITSQGREVTFSASNFPRPKSSGGSFTIRLISRCSHMSQVWPTHDKTGMKLDDARLLDFLEETVRLFEQEEGGNSV